MISHVGSRIVKNSLFNVIRTCLTVPITLLITPYTIYHLGQEEFGVWALVGVISSYAQLSDFGITESLIKFMAEFKAREETEKLNQLINTAISIYLVLGAAFGILFVAVLPFVVENILRIPPLLAEKALLVFSIAIMLFFVNMLMGVFGSLIIGFQRMEYSNVIALSSTIISAVGTVYFLAGGYGIQGLIYNNAINTAFIITANLLAAKHLFPMLRINPVRYFKCDILRVIFSFSWKVQISNITQLMIFQIDRVLLSHYVGLVAVSHYEVANRVASQVRGFVTSIFTPMVPAASTLHAVSDGDRVTGLYRRSFKYMAIAAIPFSILVVALAHPFIRTWLGPDFETSAFTLQLLAFSYMLNLLTGPGGFILSGINKPEVGMRSSIMAGVTNLVLCLLLVTTIGYYGVIIGIATSIITSGLYFIWLVHRHISGLRWQLYRQTLLRPLMLSFLLAGVLMTADSIFTLRGYPALLFSAAVYMAVVIAGLFKGDYLDEFDRSMFDRLMPFKAARS
jgi:O-antigen/teichoic acid export membrane protein